MTEIYFNIYILYIYNIIYNSQCFTIPTSSSKQTNGGSEESGLSGWVLPLSTAIGFSTDTTSSEKIPPKF
jgi:hypothetical protein